MILNNCLKRIKELITRQNGLPEEKQKRERFKFPASEYIRTWMGIILERPRNVSGIESCLWKWIREQPLAAHERENERENEEMITNQLLYGGIIKTIILLALAWQLVSVSARPTDRRIHIHIARMIQQFSIHHKFYNLLLCGNSAQAQILDHSHSHSHLSHHRLSFFRSPFSRLTLSHLCLWHSDAIIN